ncbi:MAG: hypothetical protein HGA95_00070 [Caldiserica bacterium]|nr:hypothetical protein [Caldisericota bacterium]
MEDALGINHSRTAISLRYFRQTALFFDYVIPLNIAFETMLDLNQGKAPSKIEDSLSISFLSGILPPFLKGNQEFIRVHVETNQLMSNLTIHMIQNMIIEKSLDTIEFDAKCHELASKATNNIYQIISNYGLEKVPIDPTLSTMFGKQSNNCDVIISVASLKLIDISKTSWKQIIEFRKDKEAVSKLRRFRLFAFDTYKDKSKAYMEDHILTCLEDYNDTVKQWGFETLEGTIDSVINSKLMAGFLSGALIASIIGQPTSAAILALTGAAIEIGSLSLKFAKRKIAFGELAKTHPVSYIEYAREKLSNNG